MDLESKGTGTSSSNGIEFTESADGLRVEWDNRLVRRDRFTFWFMVLFWVIWCPATLFMTLMLYTAASMDSPIAYLFLVIWLVGGWLGTIGIPLFLLNRRSVEWIEIGQTGVSIGLRGPLPQKLRHLAWSQIDEIALGRYNDGSDHESMMTVNVFLTRGKYGLRRRLIPGYWLANGLKEEIYERIRSFIEARNLPVKTRIMENAR
jgi:hypothetical protein